MKFKFHYHEIFDIFSFSFIHIVIDDYIIILHENFKFHYNNITIFCINEIFNMIESILLFYFLISIITYSLYKNFYIS